MAKYLEEELLTSSQYSVALQSAPQTHCSTCKCKQKGTVAATTTTTSSFHEPNYSIGTQTLVQGGDTNNSLCLRCNSNLNSPSRSSPYIMKLAKGSAGGGSDRDETDSTKGQQPFRKEELQVNPILGHHRLCDRNSSTLNGGTLQSNSNNTKSSHTLVPTMEQAKKAAEPPATSLLPSSCSFNNTLIKNIKVGFLKLYFGFHINHFHPSHFYPSR